MECGVILKMNMLLVECGLGNCELGYYSVLVCCFYDRFYMEGLICENL